MKLIFLDIDGVLNAHEKLPSGYCGIIRPCVDQLNRILAAVPDAQLVISSAWRYLILNGSMTLEGFENLLLSHGVNCLKRIRGHTGWDGALERTSSKEDWDRMGLFWRQQQINSYIMLSGPPGSVLCIVVDDLELNLPNFIKTDGLVGLTVADADKAIALLSGEGTR